MKKIEKIELLRASNKDTSVFLIKAGLDYSKKLEDILKWLNKDDLARSQIYTNAQLNQELKIYQTTFKDSSDYED